ncbi:DNA segregation ATPase FtsK/SpoIIIE and related protein [Candidatus Vecturithrix granuli]|uniref:DNA segregation ATPase FtsK/SpoIIIE and related protein n=1 Tax=Vecturithrix granuli TaxID=1499967 RepID=A0A081C4F5_VECG1|nr:DNA segregation ATPase FtsK/SpoIIIE and related protein [Candidatus Vecturithrix granuli]
MMRSQKIRGIVLLVVIIMCAVVYKIVATSPPTPGLQEAQLTYETEKIQLMQENLKRDNSLKFYATIGLIGALNLSLLILSSGYVRARVKRSSVHTAHIGKHSSIPVHYKDIQSFYPIAVNLSLAEIEASTTKAHEQAYQISRQMIEDITNYTRAISGKRGLNVFGIGQPEEMPPSLPASTFTPSFAELLAKGIIAPGKPMILGYNQGQPQFRSLNDLKSLAIAGWQGSGKTLSTAYIIASSVLTQGVYAYVIDPHKNHEEGLYALIKPLEKTGHVKVINPFDTPTLIQNLSNILDRRLTGKEPSTPGILLVIDELARLSKMECFDELVAFLERCTEETRKANITFIGGSHKWTARHFKGRADIRGCMNSMLIHKTKPSQADLLIEDSHDKHLVKQIQHPGEAILVTDFDTPILVSIPLCTRDDMNTVADTVNSTYAEIPPFSLQLDLERIIQHEVTTKSAYRSTISSKNVLRRSREDQTLSKVSTPETASSEPDSSPSSSQSYPKDVIPFDLHRRKHKIGRKTTYDVSNLTLDHIQQQFQKRKQQDAHFTQTELARRTGLSPGYLSRLLRGQSPLTSKNKIKFYKALFVNERLEVPVNQRC